MEKGYLPKSFETSHILSSPSHSAYDRIRNCSVGRMNGAGGGEGVGVDNTGQ